MNINKDFTIIHSCSVCNQEFMYSEEFTSHSCASYLKNMINGLDKRLKQLEKFVSENKPCD